MKITISIGNSRMERRWNRITLTLEELRERICTTRRTAETVEQYRKMPKAQQDSIKDVGGFVMGTLRDGRRRKENVVSRSGLTLDMDYAAPDTIDHLEMFTSFHCMIYSTHKHTPEKPRLRLIVPLAREVTPDEYIAVARKVAEEIGIEQFDDTTYEPSRLMYWPSTSADGEFVFREITGDLLAPDAVLTKYTNWRNVAEWPVSNRQQTLVQRDAQRQADPLTKTGAVGAFCRTYSIRDAIETFLPSVYKPSAMPGRYDYIPADSQAGVVIYEEKFCYSHHASDPVCGQLLNAFDVVRLHKFGQLDAKTSEDTDPGKRPSFKAMQEFAVQDERVKATLAAERMAQAQQEFDSEDEWQRQLDLDRTGAVRNTLRNITLIVQHDPALKDIVFNQLADSMEIKGDVPWKHPARFWRDADDAQLISYVDSFYGSFSARNYELAITKVTDDRSYHPILEFLNALPEWDRTVRADTLLIDYLGAADTAYVRAVTRKTLCAAVARVQHPGTKFDNILVLNGPQGIGKSTLIALLGGEWYSDSLSILLVFMFDRLGRKEDETPFLVQWFIEHGIEVWSTREGQQRLDGRADKLINYIRFWQAGGESEKTSIRVKAAQTQMTADGIWRGGARPFGYKLIHKGRVGKKNRPLYDLEIDEVEGPIVKEIFDMVCYEGYGTLRLANFLNAKYPHLHKIWTAQTIRSLLRNILYTGRMHMNDTLSEPIESLRLIQDSQLEFAKYAIQSRIPRKYNQQRAAENLLLPDDAETKTSVYGATLLSGILYCAHCDHKLVGSYCTKQRPTGAYHRPIYRCYNGAVEAKRCNGQSVYSAKKIESAVLEIVHQYFNSINQSVDGVWRAQVRRKFRAKQAAKLRAANTEMEKLKQQQIALREEVLKSLTGESSFSADLLRNMLDENKVATERARQQLETCKQESETEEAKLHHLESQYKSIASWAQEFDSAPIDTKKMILARIIQRITVDRNYHIVIRFFVSIDDFESTINVRDSDIHVEQTGSFIETIA